MDQLQRAEITLLQSLQQTFPDLETPMLAISRFGAPRNAFLLCFPIAFCFFGARSGLQVLWVAVISEWLNSVLKWLMIGQRPYWWVMESNVYTGEERPFLKQFKITCETGPGCPSGHAMVAASVWFVFVASLNEYIMSEVRSVQRAKKATRITWTIYSLFIVLVCVSRVYTATHFPHQVILGALTGIIVAAETRKLSVENYGFGTYFLGGLFVLVSIFLEYYLISLVGLDPGWSMKLALKRCVYREWVHMDTTLFYAISRDVGAFFFAGMMCSCLTVKYDRVRGQFAKKLTATLLTVAAAHVIESMYVPRGYVILFYILGALKYGLVSISTVGLNQAVSSYGSQNQNL
ncbi:glucose-6-phosphatase 3 [Strongylocentrotus purpuratus]|uniref:Glucose-6-phosphatase n=1 Tax=Strongylocentrotus purpuratus TaxID=7668 RepID=A0A7M7HPT9_STRPU|nr:glucose-6-phosphatase 3 [Strongylocentrotus purpuratus]